jgi:hypothetical protein
MAAINGIPITLSVLRVQDKIEGASQRSILSGALAKNRVLDLGLAEAERLKRKDKDSNKIVQKYGEIYVQQGRADIEADDEDEQKVKPWKAKYKIMANWVISEEAMDAQARLRRLGLNPWSYNSEVWLRLKHQE